MTRVRLTILVVVALCVGTVAGHAAHGTYAEVAVEAFQSWGFLGLGTWTEIEPNLVAVRIDGLPAADAAHVEEIQSACGGGAVPAAACAPFDELTYRVSRSLGITPDLETTYRVILTNRTEDLLGVVLEIDGLNTNGSEPVIGTAEDRKWILRAGQTAMISGWQVSEDKALAFRFETPSQTHSPIEELRGMIRVHIYLPDPTVTDIPKGTGAAEVIDQPTVKIPFLSATEFPVESFAFSYARGEVGLGFLCEETDGAGVQISNVVSGTIAELKGLRVGDVITYINATPINGCGELAGFLASKVPGDRVVLKVHREQRAFLLTLELTE